MPKLIVCLTQPVSGSISHMFLQMPVEALCDRTASADRMRRAQNRPKTIRITQP